MLNEFVLPRAAWMKAVRLTIGMHVHVAEVASDTGLKVCSCHLVQRRTATYGRAYRRRSTERRRQTTRVTCAVQYGG